MSTSSNIVIEHFVVMPGLSAYKGYPYRKHPRMNLQRRITALIVLTAYVVTGTSLMPVLLFMLASLDGSHTVLVRQSGESTQLVLHHNAGHYTPQICDHARPLARMLVSLCRPDQEGDHNLVAAHLSSNANAERDALKGAVKKAAVLNFFATSAMMSWVPPLTAKTSATGSFSSSGRACAKQRQRPVVPLPMLI